MLYISIYIHDFFDITSLKIKQLKWGCEHLEIAFLDDSYYCFQTLETACPKNIRCLNSV